LHKLTEEVKKFQIGNGAAEGVNIGPLINAKGVQKVQEHVEDALNQGARIAFQLDSDDALVNNGDNFFKPTILADVTPSMRCSYEETFGPIAPLIRFSTESEVIELANDTSAGLAAYFYTKDLGRSFRVTEALEYGMVGVNEGILSTEVAPFGGIKESGSGREGSKYGMDDYLEIKYALMGGI
jgi:succinate-semialdehyde dehydrogenase/glutarate-semialdehyde dehydrogenase